MPPLKEHDPILSPVPSSSASPLSQASFDDEPLSSAEAELTRVDVVLHAELIRGRLEAHGIPARLTDTHIAGLAPHLGAAIGGVRVIVARSDLEAARALLEAPASDVDDDDSDDDDLTASRAGLPAVGPAETAARWALWSALLSFVVPIGGQVGSAFMIWRALSMAPPIGAPLAPERRRVLALAVVIDIVAAGVWTLLLS